MRYEQEQATLADDYEAPYEPVDETAYEYGYEEEPKRGPNVMWGRVAVLLALLLVAFLIGRATVNAGIPKERFDDVQSQLATAEAENERLAQERDEARAEVTSLEDQLATAEEGTDPTTDTATAADTTEAGEEFQGQVHIVQEGETLLTIAEDYYENGELGNFIAEYNDLSNPDIISPGDELLIPDRPEL